MSRRRSFVYDMFPQDFMSGIVGLDDAVVGVYIKLINLMHMYEGPLPPRSTRLAKSEFDEWLRDKLGHKNVRTWLRAKRVLLADPDKLVEMPDGRIINPRVARDLAKREGPKKQRPDDDEGGGNQGSLSLTVVDNTVGNDGKPVGQAAISGDDRPNIERSSGEVRSIRASKSLKSHDSRCVYPYPYIRIPHDVAAAGTRFRARARGDPAVSTAA